MLKKAKENKKGLKIPIRPCERHGSAFKNLKKKKKIGVGRHAKMYNTASMRRTI